MCLNDNMIFDTIKMCVEYYDIDKSSITKNIQGVYKNPQKKFLLLDIYNKMLSDEYNEQYIFNNHQDLIIKYKNIDK